ncbi:DUF3168 domain-containing protein [Malikia sp.]|uniref:DUF3168 domain-containing protein n=1 Tax=Malikia sp. TaxID=2070706 RepID=UPI0026199955|nr:DUF3168 domain-containing protein [Malikia sp.]MDD2728174.1 DUF3168 domain-containing protein [Malikia sp.]
MSIQEQLYDLLSGHTDAGSRVFPQVAPEGTEKPYIVYQRVSSSSENTLDGRSGLVNTRMQIDVFARTYAQALSVTSAIDGLMDAWEVQNISILSADSFEPDTRLHRVTSDYSIWHG